MARVILPALVVFCSIVFAGQSPQSQDLPAQPASPQTPHANAPPADSSGAQSSAGANARIKSSIQDLLSSDPVVNGADVQVTVDDRKITLSGVTESYAQHQRVLQLVEQYRRWRQIVDRIH